jgi:bla regulator protein blaR1
MSFSFLFEMTWKSLIITGAALMLVALLRNRSPADRAAVLRLGVALLLALPVIALGLPALQVEMAAEPAQPLPFETLLAMASAPPPIEIAPLEPVPVTIWDDPSSLILIAYLGGLFMVGARIVGGLWTLSGWTRRAEPVADPVWVEAFERTRPERGPGSDARLLVSDETPSPLSWGWRRPAILIDRDTLGRAEDADGILAHEVAHLVRRDWLALMMTRISVALFWFNPLVWLLEREVVQQAEEAADTAALGCVEPTHYAQTLVTCAQAGRGAPLPANSISPLKGGLGRRVSAILDGRNGRVRSGSFWTLAAMLGCTAFAAPLAAVELVPALAAAVEEAPAAAAAPLAPLAPVAAVQAVPAAPPAPSAVPAPEAPPAVPAPLAPIGDGEIVVPAVNVDIPEQVVHVPEIRIVENGVKVHVPAMTVRAPRVKVAVPPIRVRVPTPPVPPTPAVLGIGALGHPHWSAEDQAEMEADIREAQEDARREAAEARAEALAEAAEARREAQREIGRSQREVHRAMHKVRVDMSRGAEGMERGAEGMVRGARQMEAEADRLRDPAYRERQIAKAAAEGRTVTHQELIDAIPKLREGSKKMLAGAQNMREAAARMRRGGSH